MPNPQDATKPKAQPMEMTADEWESYVANRLGVPEHLYKSLTRQESGGQHRRANGDVMGSVQGARGRYQVMPETAKMYGMNPDDEFDNIYAGLRYLKDSYEKVRSSVPSDEHAWMAAVAGYHGGPRQLNHIAKTGQIAPGRDANMSTVDYVDNIMKGWAKRSEQSKTAVTAPPAAPPTAVRPQRPAQSVPAFDYQQNGDVLEQMGQSRWAQTLKDPAKAKTQQKPLRLTWQQIKGDQKRLANWTAGQAPAPIDWAERKAANDAAQQAAQAAYVAKQQAAAPTSAVGRAATNFARGLAETVPNLSEGFARLQPTAQGRQLVEQALNVRGQRAAIDDTLPVDPTKQDFLTSTLPQGAASMLKMAAMGPLAVPVSSVEQMNMLARDAEARGASEGQVGRAMLGGIALGATELGGAFGRGATRTVQEGTWRTALREAVQETGQQAGENLVASDFAGYDPQRRMLDNVPEAAAAGAILGGAASKAGQVVNQQLAQRGANQQLRQTVGDFAQGQRTALDQAQQNIAAQLPVTAPATATATTAAQQAKGIRPLAASDQLTDAEAVFSVGKGKGRRRYAYDAALYASPTEARAALKQAAKPAKRAVNDAQRTQAEQAQFNEQADRLLTAEQARADAEYFGEFERAQNLNTLARDAAKGLPGRMVEPNAQKARLARLQNEDTRLAGEQTKVKQAETREAATTAVLDASERRAKLEASGDYMGAAAEVAAEIAGLQAKEKVTSDPAEKAALARTLFSLRIKRNDLVRQARTPQSSTPQTPAKPAPAARGGNLLDSVVNPDGGVPKNKTASVDFGYLAKQQPREQAAGASGKLERGQNLLEFVRQNGGIRPSVANRGELSYADIKEGGRIGVVRQDGISADEMRRQALEAGFNAGETEAEFLTALRDGRAERSDKYRVSERLAQEENDYYAQRAATDEAAPTADLPSQPLDPARSERLAAATSQLLPKLAQKPDAAARAEEQANTLLDAIDRRDSAALKTLLHTGNQTSRKIFEQDAGVTLGKTNATMADAVDQWAAQAPAPSDYARFAEANAALIDQVHNLPLGSQRLDAESRLRDAAAEMGIEPRHAEAAISQGRNYLLARGKSADLRERQQARQQTPTPAPRRGGDKLPATNQTGQMFRPDTNELNAPPAREATAPFDSDVRALRGDVLARLTPQEVDTKLREVEGRYAEAVRKGADDLTMRALETEARELKARRRELVKAKQLPALHAKPELSAAEQKRLKAEMAKPLSQRDWSGVLRQEGLPSGFLRQTQPTGKLREVERQTEGLSALTPSEPTIRRQYTTGDIAVSVPKKSVDAPARTGYTGDLIKAQAQSSPLIEQAAQKGINEIDATTQRNSNSQADTARATGTTGLGRAVARPNQEQRSRSESNGQSARGQVDSAQPSARISPTAEQQRSDVSAVTGRQLQHQDKGILDELADQKGVVRGKVRVRDQQGNVSIVQRPSGHLGNQKAAWLKTGSLTMPKVEATAAVQGAEQLRNQRKAEANTGDDWSAYTSSEPTVRPTATTGSIGVGRIRAALDSVPETPQTVKAASTTGNLQAALQRRADTAIAKIDEKLAELDVKRKARNEPRYGESKYNELLREKQSLEAARLSNVTVLRPTAEQIQVIEKAKNQKTDRTGFTPAQKDYLVDRLSEAAQIFIDSKSNHSVSIAVPGAGRFTLSSPREITELLLRIDKPALKELKKSPSAVSLPSRTPISSDFNKDADEPITGVLSLESVSARGSWRGAYSVDKEWATDGHIAIRIADLPASKATPFKKMLPESERQRSSARTPATELVGNLIPRNSKWQSVEIYEGARLRGNNLLSYAKTNFGDVALDAQKLKLIQEAASYDNVQSLTKGGPLFFRKGEQIQAILMPMRNDEQAGADVERLKELTREQEVKVEPVPAAAPKPAETETKVSQNVSAPKVEATPVPQQSEPAQSLSADAQHVRRMISEATGGKVRQADLVRLAGLPNSRLRPALEELLNQGELTKAQGVLSIKSETASPIVKHQELMTRLQKGDIKADEFKAAFEEVVANKESIKAELATLTKAQLFERFPSIEYRYKNETKADAVKAAYNRILDGYVLADSVSWMMGSSYTESVRKLVNATTDTDIAKYAEKVKQAQVEREAKREATKAGIKDPKTIEDYKNLMRAKLAEMGNETTFQQLRMALTPEQRANFDELAATESRNTRRARADQQKTEVRAAGQSMTGQVLETKHTKTGEPLFVVKAAERDVYNQWNATAKRLGGWYSSFRGAGAIPGFQFKTRENANAFLEYLGGKVEQAKEAVQARRDAMADDKSQTAVERLREMADSLAGRAEEALAVERKQNTERRARFAASAEAAANADKALASTMRNIADAIESGKAKFLDRVRQKAQVEMLQGFVRSGQDEYLREKYPSYIERERHFGEAPTNETADYVQYPSYTAYRSDLAKLGRQLIDNEGTKKLGVAILKVADDVTGAYVKFAKANLEKVSTFKRHDGKGAVFASKEQAEKAIARSGYKGQAIVLPVKRGENVIVLSPSAARERGIWEGDDDKRITLNTEFGDELVAKLKRQQGRGLDIPWTFEAANEKHKRLVGMGIESPAELRAALREFIGLREAAKAPDKIKEMERAMIGRKNDGLDFFPTPAATADRMIEVAGIEEGMTVLEPSAGMGHIADRIRETGVDPDVMEMSSDRRALLEAKGYNVAGTDFKEADARPTYDRIVMNPPFSNRRDVEHVQHAYEMLKPGGRLVALMGEGSFFGSDKKATAFREWLESVGGTSEKLEEGTFTDPSLPVNTGVNARLVVIDKTADAETAPSVRESLAKAGSEALTGINKLIGGGTGTLRSGLAFDDKAYAAAKPHFEAALQSAGRAMSDAGEILQHIVREFRQKFNFSKGDFDGIAPYLRHFIKTEVLTRRRTLAEVEALPDIDRLLTNLIESAVRQQFGLPQFAADTLDPVPANWQEADSIYNALRSRVAALKQQGLTRDEVEARYAELAHEVAEAQLAERDENLEDIFSSLRDLKKEQAQIAAQLAKKETALQAAEAEFDQREKAIDAAEEARRKAAADLEEAEYDGEDLDAEIDELADEITDFEDDEERKTAQAELATKQAKRAQLKQQANDAAARLKQAEKELDRAGSDYDKASDKVRDLETEVHDLKVDRDSASTEISETEESLAEEKQYLTESLRDEVLSEFFSETEESELEQATDASEGAEMYSGLHPKMVMQSFRTIARQAASVGSGGKAAGIPASFDADRYADQVYAAVYGQGKGQKRKLEPAAIAKLDELIASVEDAADRNDGLGLLKAEDAVLAHLTRNLERTRGEKAKRLLAGTAALTRGLVLSGDAALLRNLTNTAFTNPRAAAKKVAHGFGAMLSADEYYGLAARLRADDNFQAFLDAGGFSNIHAKQHVDFNPLLLDDTTMGGVTDKIPLLRGLERMNAIATDEARLQAFTDFAKRAKGNETVAQAAALYANAITGRGNLKQGGLTNTAGALLTSARYMASFPDSIYRGVKLVAAMPKAQRKGAAATVAAQLAGRGLLTLVVAGGLTALTGAAVNWDDPEDSAWLKARMQDGTEIDASGGSLSYWRAMARVAATWKDRQMGVRQKTEITADILRDFTIHRLAPAARSALELVSLAFNEDELKRPAYQEALAIVAESFAPIFMQNAATNLAENKGVGRSTGEVTASVAGLNVNQYERTKAPAPVLANDTPLSREVRRLGIQQSPLPRLNLLQKLFSSKFNPMPARTLARSNDEFQKRPVLDRLVKAVNAVRPGTLAEAQLKPMEPQGEFDQRVTEFNQILERAGLPMVQSSEYRNASPQVQRSALNSLLARAENAAAPADQRTKNPKLNWATILKDAQKRVAEQK